MRSVSFVVVLVLAFCEIAPGQSRPATQAIRTSDPIPRATLVTMYQRELGPKFDPATADKLYAAHRLLEDYFEQADKRKEIIKSLESTGIDPNILGRIVRIRMYWPDLKGGVYYINERIGPHGVHYFLGLPAGYDRTKSWPLVIKLPTADAFLTEPMPDADQVRGIYTAWMTDELTRHPDAIVIMPLLNLDELWGPSYPGMNSVFQPMLHAANRVNIDPARVYILGHSMSAHAVWNLALHYPMYFASFCALAGSANADWQRLRIIGLKHVLPVVWHDTDDPVIRVDAARRLVKVLRTQKINVEYEETKKLGHIPPDMIVQKCYERMRSKMRELYPKQVSLQSNRPDTIFNRNDWIQIYQPLRPGDDKRIYFQHGSGFMVVHVSLWKLEATLEANRITATSQNVEAMRFYLNDQMIDFTKPVTVNVNRKGRFEGVVKPSVEEMLKDQLFAGRGWRYFTATVDVDFADEPSTKTSTRPTTRPAGER